MHGPLVDEGAVVSDDIAPRRQTVLKVPVRRRSQPRLSPSESNATMPIMDRHRRVKIVATLGPATDAAGRVLALAEAGVDVFRLNASHGDHATLAARAEQVRRAEAALGRPLALLLDLQGPKLRVGQFADGAATLADGARFRLDLDPQPGDHSRAPFPHGDIYDALTPGTRLLLDDGRLELEVTSQTGAGDSRALDCQVVRGACSAISRASTSPAQFCRFRQ